ncbi:MAG: PIN domain-containing protein [Chloroflexi bacterium]|nr:MAG: PIN domain-containing protein [Chloroflexota bacterium]
MTGLPFRAILSEKGRKGHRALKVVLDTNLFVAAGFNPRSRSARILGEVAKGALAMAWNDGTRGEIRAVLTQIPPLSWERWADLFREEHRHRGETHPERFSLVPDPEDRKFAALAEATGATLVSNDAHLLAGRDEYDFPILSPGEFWDSYLEQS